MNANRYPLRSPGRTHSVRILLVYVAALPVCVRAETLGFWRFEGNPGKSPAGQPVASESNKDVLDGIGHLKVKLRYDAEVPEPYVYDPVAGTSYKNTSSLFFQSNANTRRSDYIEVPFDPRKPPLAGLTSFTIEMFVRAGDLLTDPNERVPVIRKSRLSEDAATWELNVFCSPPPHKYNWWQASVTAPGEKQQDLSHNTYLGISHVNNTEWRHVALVYDAEGQTASYYIDYTLRHAVRLPKPLVFDAGALLIGGQPRGRGFVGLIDEVRFSKTALPPWLFLRATPHDLKDVSFEPKVGLFPFDSGYSDIRLRFGAIGDGIHDDTKAFQLAFRDLPDKPFQSNTLYLSNGTYLVSDTLRWSRFFVLQGESREHTIIKLKDNCPGFTDPKTPKPVVVAGWGGRERGCNDAHANYVFNLTIDTGKGNPGAIALDFQAHNTGAVVGVTLRSADGEGVIGLDETRPWPGPCLFKDIRIEGFDTGIAVAHPEYSLTFEKIFLTGQKTAGIETTANILCMRKLTSNNKVPALVHKGESGMVVLLDSELSGGAPETCAIVNEGSLYARNVKTTGYKAALRNNGKVVEGANLDEFVTGEVLSVFPSPNRSLNLPVEEPPDVPWGDIKDWVNVTRFASKVKDGDWADAIQAAIDSAKDTVYFPGPSYFVKSTVIVRPKIKRLLGMRTTITADPYTMAGMPVLRIMGTTEEPLVIERLSAGSSRPGERLIGFEHASERPVILRHGGGEYKGNPRSGKLFAEDRDGGPWYIAKDQKVWAWQLNPETTDIPEITNDGGQLWILGFKTEGPSTNIVNQNGARTEVLGGLVYPCRAVPEDMPMFINENSFLSFIIATSSYIPNGNHTIWVHETRNRETRTLRSSQVKPQGGRQKVNLYTGYPEGK